MHPAFGGRNLLRVNLDDVANGRRLPGDDRRVRGRSSDGAVDHGRRMGDVSVPRRRPAQGGAGSHRPGPPRVPDEPRRTRGVGERSRARDRAGSPGTRPTRGTGASSATRRRGSRPAALHEGAAYSFRDRWVPRDRPGGVAPCVARRAAAAARARDHRRGRTHGSRRTSCEAYGALEDAGELTMRVSREPVVGPAPGRRADRRTGRTRPRRDERQRPRDDREDHDGRRRRELLVRAAGAVRRSGRVPVRPPRPVVRRR